MDPLHSTPTRLGWRTALLATSVLCASAGCDMQQDTPPPALNITLDGVDVTGTTINDGLVQAGEVVVAQLFITNRADSAYTDVLIRSEGMVVSVDDRDRTTFIPRFEPGQTVRLRTQFFVEPGTPVGTRLPTDLILRTPAEVSVTLPLGVTTSALPYEPVAEGAAVIADTDGDGRVEPGEEATVRFSAGFRGGPTDVTCLGYTASSSLAQVTILTDPGDCSSAPERTFRFRASSLLAPGTTLPFVIRLRDRLGNTYDFPVSVPLG